MNEVKVCGVILSDDRSIVDIYATTDLNGVTTMFFNNEPFGIVSMEGFQGEKIGTIGEINPMTKYVDTMPVYNGIRSIVENGSRGRDIIGAIYLEDGLILIKDLYPFEAVKQPHKLVAGAEEEYTVPVDVAEVDEEFDDYDDLMGFFDYL